MKNDENMEHPQERDYQNGEAENEKANYTPMTSDEDEADQDGEEDAISGDLAGNASGNEDAEDE